MAENEQVDVGPEVAAAFEALARYDWGHDPAALRPITEALRAAAGGSGICRAIEARLAGVLGSAAPRAARIFACRTLSRTGGAAAVPALAALLGDRELSHMARFALERMPSEEAAGALRGALEKVEGELLIGVINSLGARRDPAASATLTGLLDAARPGPAAAAAAALGEIGTRAAADALAAFRARARGELRLAAAAALLACAERLLEAGERDPAAGIYNELLAGGEPEHVRRAAALGRDAAARRR